MKSERWKKIESIFHEAKEKTDDERKAFLDKACDDDFALRKEIEALIASSDTSDSFLETPILEKALTVFARKRSEMIVGQLFGHFKILSSIGAGGMGEVYLAEDLNLGRKIALKLLPLTLVKETEQLRRFDMEARSASSLNHPNIVTVYEIGSEKDAPFIALEYVDGVTLRHRLSQSPLKIEEALDVAIQVGSALIAAHSAGIVHRDIKPENIMIRSDGLIKVLDFGLAKRIKQIETEPHIMVHTTAGTIIGTANYMSPEQVRAIEIDERTDIWSLGVMLYEMLTGRAPFEEETTSDLIAAILKTDPPKLHGFIQNAPAKLQQILDKVLEKDRNKRYRTAHELVQDLKELKENLPSSDKTVPNLSSINQPYEPIAPLSKLTNVSSRQKQSIRLLTIIFLAALLIVAVATALRWYPGEETAQNKPQQSPIQPVNAAPEERELSFWLTVQKMHNGKSVESRFNSSGREIFKQGDQFWMNFNSAKNGYLYVINEGPELQSGLPRYTILFPLYEDSSQKVFANQTVETPPQTGPGYFFDLNKGTEKVWIVWSENPLTELDVVKVAANAKDRGFVKDMNQRKMLQEFLNKHLSSKPAVNDNNQKVVFKFKDALLVCVVELEHQ